MDNSTTTVSNATTNTDHFTTFEMIFYLGNGCLGAMFNTIVLFIAVRHIDTDDKPRQIIVMNMTAADLLFCLTYVLTRPFLSMFPVGWCKPYYVVIWMVQMCSCLNLLWLNVDKLLYIQFPLHYYNIVSRKRVLAVTIGTWSSLIVYSFVIMFSMTINGKCVVAMFDPLFPYITMCVYYVVVIIASFTISGIIFYIAQTTTSMEQRQRTRLFQRLLFLFSSTLWTFITCVPFRIFFLLNMLCAVCRSYFLANMTTVFFKLLVVGTVINPLITIMTQRVYRYRLMSYIRTVHEVVSFTTEDTMTSNGRRQSSKATITMETAPLTTSL